MALTAATERRPPWDLIQKDLEFLSNGCRSPLKTAKLDPAAMEESDEDLMLRAGQGERAACELLAERHLGRVLSFAQRTLHNRSDAEDVAQDVFLRVWTAAPRWQ